jgi:cytochrome P450
MDDAVSIGGVDLTQPATYVDGMPYDAFRRLRTVAPVAWHPQDDGPGFYALTGHAEVVAVSRDSSTFSSEATGVFFAPPGDEEASALGLMMLTMDPPRHTRLRALVSRGFTPRHVARLHDRVADMARAIVDAVAPLGACDFVRDVAGALPSMVIAELLGIPLDDGRTLYALTEQMHTASDDPTRSAARAAQAQMFSYATQLAARKLQEPGDDIASSLLAAEVDGERLTGTEFNFFFMLLINAGGDTTRNLVAGAALALMDHPDELARLRARPDLLPTAVEEMLRYVSPVIVFSRTATRDVELRGVPIHAGQRVAMFYPAANRDEFVFDDPDRFDVSRDPNPHVAFGGGGTHFCLGANLARVEIAALMREVLVRMPDLTLEGPVQRLQSNLINGVAAMPVRFTPNR